LNDAHVKSAIDLLPYSRGEIFQDLFVALCLDMAEPGFFVEFGATNGVDGSNSWLFEKAFGWNGIVAEPGRGWHYSLSSNRNCTIVKDCVWSESGKRLEFVQAQDAGLSTLTSYANNDRHSIRRSNGKTYFVQTVSLHDMLVRTNAPIKIDYLSIDTEGSEFDILSCFPFSNWDISIITVEHNFRNDRAALQELIQRHGFVRVLSHLSKFDDWYVSPQVHPRIESVFVSNQID
jgi:FkbM family methyltransferase